MNPIWRFRTTANSASLSWLRSAPASDTWPEVGRSKVPIMCNSVLFPEPDGPTIASDSPAITSSETPSSTVSGTVLSGDSYRFVTLTNFNKGAGDAIRYFGIKGRRSPTNDEGRLQNDE